MYMYIGRVGKYRGRGGERVGVGKTEEGEKRKRERERERDTCTHIHVYSEFYTLHNFLGRRWTGKAA